MGGGNRIQPETGFLPSNHIRARMPHLTWASKTPPSPVPASLELDSLVFPGGAGYPHASPENRLVLGDNLGVMSALLPEYESRFDLIYADPPFYTNRRYPARVGRDEDSRRPQDWRLAEGYPDHWTDIDAYLDMLYPRLYLMYRLLAPNGTLYLHLDWHADHYARLLLDEIFGPERLLNEIVWVYHGPSPIRTAFNRKHDIILAYTKGDRYTFNVESIRAPYNPNTVKTFESSPRAGFGKIPDLERGKVPEDWWYFPVVARLHNERTGYPTQKPESLLERILLASSNPGDLVGDFFCGSGTTPVVAARLGRKFIANDGAWRAVLTSRARLVSNGAPPFLLQILAGGQPPASRDQNVAEGIVLSKAVLALDNGLLEDLDYWEADPDWDGKVFRSAVQAVRPRKHGSIPDRLELPRGYESAGPVGGQQICVRLVKINGEQSSITRPGDRT
jgi:DNA modification methylase